MSISNVQGWRVLLGLLLLATPSTVSAQPAFPGAVGFGAGTTGGRGGAVLHVTTLAASGTGSLAWAASQPGARYIVFDVSGVIEADVAITESDVTIAGQTAPGAGVTIHGHLSTPYRSSVGNIIVRHLRVRPPGAGGDWSPDQHDAIQMSSAHDLIFDHVDASHGIDEIVDHWDGAQRVTWQWSVISFPNPSGGHSEGAHPYGLINGPGGGNFSVQHVLFAHCRTRTPALAEGPADVLNNVVYNGREGFVHHNPVAGDFVIAGNTYRDGPSQNLAPFWFDPENTPTTRYFMGDNEVQDPGVFEGIVDNPYTTAGFASEYTFACCGIDSSQFFSLSEAPDWSGEAGWVSAVRDSPAASYSEVLDCAGAWPRDFVTRAAVQETRDRSGSLRLLALDDLMAGLTAGAPPTDTDGDGMPDAWEMANGFDASSDDHLASGAGGYPAIEVYLNALADGLTPCGGGVVPVRDGGPPSLDGSVPMLDGGSTADGGRSDGGGAGRPDGSTLGMDAGSDGGTSDGCGCHASGGRGLSGVALLSLLALVFVRARRRR